MLSHTQTDVAALSWTGTRIGWRLSATIAAFLGCLGGVGTLHAADKPLPDAAVILDRFVEVTGGAAAYEKIHNRVKKGHHEFVDVGLQGTDTVYYAAPNKKYAEFEAEEIGKVLQGTDGNVVWYFSEGAGPMVEEGDARTVALRDAAFDDAVNWRKYYQKVECTAEETVEGKTCYKIVMTPAVGKTETRYFEKESGLLVKVEKTRLSSQMPPTPVEILLSDYRSVDGLLLAHRTKQITQQCGSKREILFTADSIEHNVTLLPDRFDPPAKVQAAANAQRGSADVKDVSGRDDGARQSKQPPCSQTKEAAPETEDKTRDRSPCGGGS